MILHTNFQFMKQTILSVCCILSFCANAQNAKTDSLITHYLNAYNRMVMLQTQAAMYADDISNGEQCPYKYNEIGYIARYLNVEAIKLTAQGKLDNNMNDATLKKIIDAIEGMRPSIKRVIADYPEIKRDARFDQIELRNSKTEINKKLQAQNEVFAAVRKMIDENASQAVLPERAQQLYRQIESDSIAIRKMCIVETAERLNALNTCSKSMASVRNFLKDNSKARPTDLAALMKQRTEQLRYQKGVLTKLEAESKDLLAIMDKNPRDSRLPARFEKFEKEFTALKDRISVQDMHDEDKASVIQTIESLTDAVRQLKEVLK